MDAGIFGMIVADVIGQPLDFRAHPPPPGGLQFVGSITLTTGGNVCNTGIAMARLGMSVAAAGLVGDDILGRAVLDRLRDAGIDVTSVRCSDRAQTSATVVAVEPDGERCFFHAPGASRLLDADAFRACFDVFRACAWVQIGYFGLLPTLTPDLPALLGELRQAAPGTKIALDTVNPPAEMSLLEPILPHVDLFAPSRPEAAQLTGERDPSRIAAVFRRFLPAGAVLGIKLDADGCYLDDSSQTVHVPAYPIRPVDTTGAGDGWFAGLLTALRRQMPLEQAGKFANRVAADCCLAIGASAGIRPYPDTLARL